MKATFARPRCSSLLKTRLLRIEPLEERRVLAATFPGTDDHPWHNSVYRLDVNNDGTTSVLDLLALINRVNDGDLALPVPPTGTVTRFYDTSGDNRLTATDLGRVINGLLSGPEVALSTSTLFTVDLTPHVTVKATQRGTAKIPDGTLVEVDVDVNDDGDFSDPGEIGHTVSTLVAGSANFELDGQLERRGEVYDVRMRARLKNSDAVPGESEPYSLIVDALTSDALENYVHAPDDTYQYHLATNPIAGNAVTPYRYYVLDMTSQTWRSTADVNLPVWHHWLEVYVPFGLDAQVAELDPTALLFIRGGSNTDNAPTEANVGMANLATATQSVVATLKIVPNEDVIFTDETRTREEDAIIAYSFDKFLEGIGQPGNDTWPLLLPMVKSAVRAMDTIQDFIPSLRASEEIEDFVVTGESKRGWTTWLTAAADDRVRAIMPGVFDNLNVAEQMVNHYASLGEFSEAIQDYNDMQIFQRILTPEALALSRIIDPYRYLANGRFDDMPKLLLNSAGDEFFVTDSSRFYFHDLPGTQNYLRYLPNTGHSLDTSAEVSRATFYDAVIHDRPLPKFSWIVDQDGTIRVQTETAPTSVKLWQKYNDESRDFRNAWTSAIPWESQPLSDQGGGIYSANVAMPETGARGYFIELTFPNSVLGAPDYVFTTEARVRSKQPYFAWPFESGFPEFGPTDAPLGSQAVVSPIGDDGRSAVAVALTLKSNDGGAPSVVPLLTSIAAEPIPPLATTSHRAMVLLESAPLARLTAASEAIDPLAADQVLAASLPDLW